MYMLWGGFIALICFFLLLDLGVFNRKAHDISIREALLWTAFWIAMALLFNVAIYFAYEAHWMGLGMEKGFELDGRQAAMQYFTGYLIEKSLSLDNIFVIALIFEFFKVPHKFQHRTLFWGIVGAMVLRGVMIVAGVALIRKLDWMIFVFGGLLIVTALKMLFSKHDDIDPDKSFIVKAARKIFPVKPGIDDQRFFERLDDGRLAITPLFLALLIVESSDVIFAVDSIPAIFSITYDPFIIFTSNIFAIMGLRSLYFALAAMMDKFRFLKISLVILMIFVGVKMLLAHYVHISTAISMSVIASILGLGVLFSQIFKEKKIEVPEIIEN